MSFTVDDSNRASSDDIAALKRLAASRARNKAPKANPLGLFPKITSPPSEPISEAEKKINAIKYNPGEATKHSEADLIREAHNIDVLAPALDFDNAVEWFHFLMPEFNMHDWQYEMLMLMSGYYKPGNYDDKITFDPHNPMRAIIPAANGSGKDLVLIAGMSTWFCASAHKSKVVITSSSDSQLKFQTEPHITEICRRANKRFGQTLFKWVEHYVSFPAINSSIRLFATNEAGRAEGEHPDHGGRMMLIVNEAKSIRPEIWSALARCSGYSYWLEVSSPGQDNGHFFDAYQESLKLGNHWPNPVKPTIPYSRKISGDDCPHLTQSQKLSIAKEGEIILRSSWYAEFTSLESESVIPRHLLNYCDKTTLEYTGSKIKCTTPKRVGLDIGAGKDATVMSFWAGNTFVAEERIVEKNLMSQIPWIIEKLHKQGFQGFPLIIDDNGVGQAIADEFVLRKYNIIRVRNQHRAFNTQQYLNAGAEMYANIRDHAQLQNIGDLPQKLIRELSVRRWQKYNGKWKLYDKEEDKALLEGKSPDSADAMALAWFNLRPHDLAGTKERLDALGPKPPPQNRMTMDDFYNEDVRKFKKLLTEKEQPMSYNIPEYINML